MLPRQKPREIFLFGNDEALKQIQAIEGSASLKEFSDDANGKTTLLSSKVQKWRLPTVHEFLYTCGNALTLDGFSNMFTTSFTSERLVRIGGVIDAGFVLRIQRPSLRECSGYRVPDVEALMRTITLAVATYQKALTCSFHKRFFSKNFGVARLRFLREIFHPTKAVGPSVKWSFDA
ncbi:unnamed protein product [Enterobius vermicularis]|uniref:DDE Tnp4 domain-containing protein n=1 Tax=Enterobius vermicularis TaxID=51028 RepID=A0A0N4V1A6_ENTVE|nr:unnamed protein product [Enterobius vermicularis]